MGRASPPMRLSEALQTPADQRSQDYHALASPPAALVSFDERLRALVRALARQAAREAFRASVAPAREDGSDGQA